MIMRRRLMIVRKGVQNGDQSHGIATRPRWIAKNGIGFDYDCDIPEWEALWTFYLRKKEKNVCNDMGNLMYSQN